MKRIAIIISIFQLMLFNINSQILTDGLLVSRELNSGTARSLSMSGSLGAMGGDISVVNSNPAGLAVFRKSMFTISSGIYFNTADSRFQGVTNDDYDYKFAFDNIAYVGANKTKNKQGLAGVNFALGYNKLTDFNQRIHMGPVVADGSLLDEYVNIYNDPSIELSDFYEVLAWDSYLIDYDSISDQVISYFTGTDYGQILEKNITRTGHMGEYFLSLGGNISNKFYIGGTMGIRSMKYYEKMDHFENDVNDNIVDFNSFNFREYLEMWGTGINLKFGILARPIEFLRIGAAFHSPTYMKMKYNFNTSLSSIVLVDNLPDRLTVDSDNARAEYINLTPFKGIFSMGFVIDKYGLINVDYEYVDFRTMKFDSDEGSNVFDDLNDEVQDNLQSVSNIKVGGEFNLGLLALRAGIAQHGDPFSPSHLNSVQRIRTYSAGFGIRDKNYFIDFGIMKYDMGESHNLYQDISGIAQISSIETDFYKILATFGFKF